MLGIARGLALLISDAKPVAIENLAFVNFGTSMIFGIPVSALIWVASSLLLWYFLKYRRTGRYIFAVGGSEESARLSGIDVRNVKLLVYGLCGLLTAMGGVIWAARLSSGSPIGGLELRAGKHRRGHRRRRQPVWRARLGERNPGGRAALRHDQQHPEPDGHLALLAGYDQRRADPDCGRPEPGAPPGYRPASPARCTGRREGMEGVNQRLSGMTFEARAVLKILAILLGMMALASVVSGGVFLQPGNLLNLVNQNAILTVVALGQLLVIITGGIDLSVGSTLAISSVLIVLFQDYGLFPAFVIALLAALVIGLTNGFLVTYVRLPAFVVTLAIAADRLFDRQSAQWWWRSLHRLRRRRPAREPDRILQGLDLRHPLSAGGVHPLHWLDCLLPAHQHRAFYLPGGRQPAGCLSLRPAGQARQNGGVHDLCCAVRGGRVDVRLAGGDGRSADRRLPAAGYDCGGFYRRCQPVRRRRHRGRHLHWGDHPERAEQYYEPARCAAYLPAGHQRHRHLAGGYLNSARKQS